MELLHMNIFALVINNLSLWGSLFHNILHYGLQS